MTRRLRHPVLVLIVALLVLPFVMRAVGMTDTVSTKVALFALVGIGFNLLLGYTGLVSFGHAVFFGLAAYTAALVQIHLTPGAFLAPVAAGTLFATLAGLIIGFLVLRRRGVYFSLLTLAFSAMTFYIVFRWTAFTGGENGLGGITRPVLLGVDLNQSLVFYYLCAGVVALSAWGLLRIIGSPLGRVLVAIRENDLRARFLGYPIQHYRLVSFTLSAAFVGLAGSLYAFLTYFVSADLVHVPFSGEILAMTIIGGTGHFLGPALGALFYVLFRELLSEYTASWLLWFGLLFMAFILLSPEGLMGLGERLTAPFRRGAAELAAMAARVKPQPGAAVPAFLRQRAAGRAPRRLLEASGVTKRFGGFVAVDRVDIVLHENELKVLIGPNGAGKTTFFNVLSGLYPPDTGTLRFEEKRIESQPTYAFPRMGIARSFQIINLFQGLTVRENLRLAVQARHAERFHPWTPADRLDKVNAETDALMQFVGLVGLGPAPASSLSYGGQRLLEIALALAARPRVLLLDEPLAGLAAAERERVTALIEILSQHMAVLMVEHDIDRAFSIARHITVMHNGRVLADGTPEQVRNHPQVQQVYLGRGHHRPAAASRRSKPKSAKPLLRVEGINTFYGKSHILHDVSFEARTGEILGLLGRNGAGKSSTIKSIMGIVQPRSGRILLDDQDITGLPPERVARLGVGYVPQGRRLFGGLTVAENLAIGRLRRQGGPGTHWSRERVFEYFPKVEKLLDRKAGVLSGGEQQMVAIARALVGNVRLLLLDEPFEGLAPAVVDEVFDSIDRLRSEISVVIIEHDLDRVLALADRVYVLDRGRVSHEGPAEPLLADLAYRKQVLWL